nr:LysR family transcriptional regulator substrate-binding protein [Streptomyces alfalfae]
MCVTWRTTRSWSRRAAARRGCASSTASRGARVTPTHRVRDLATLISMVQAGLGVTVLTEASRPLVPPDLVLLPVTPPASGRLALSGPRDRPWLPAVRVLAESAAARQWATEP